MSAIFSDKIVWSSLKNNVWYAIISVIFQVFIGLILAAILEAKVIKTEGLSNFFPKHPVFTGGFIHHCGRGCLGS